MSATITDGEIDTLRAACDIAITASTTLDTLPEKAVLPIDWIRVLREARSIITRLAKS